MSRAARLRRSELSTPANSAKMVEKASVSRADLVFLDLEDSVAASAKAEAREAAARALRDTDWGLRTRAVRVNGPHTPWCFEDVIDVMQKAGDRLDVLIVPKVKTAADVLFFDTLLAQIEASLGLPLGKVGLELLIEEVEAIQNLEKIAAATPRLEALILGVGDLAASQGMPIQDIGSAGPYPGDIWHYARSKMIIAARANGLAAIDGPFADFRDLEGYRREAEWAASLGASGKWAIHPAQIDVANEVFGTKRKEIERARRVIDAVEAAEREGLGATAVDGVMADAASLRICRAILERAELEHQRIGALVEGEAR